MSYFWKYIASLYLVICFVQITIAQRGRECVGETQQEILTYTSPLLNLELWTQERLSTECFDPVCSSTLVINTLASELYNSTNGTACSIANFLNGSYAGPPMFTLSNVTSGNDTGNIVNVFIDPLLDFILNEGEDCTLGLVDIFDDLTDDINDSFANGTSLNASISTELRIIDAPGLVNASEINSLGSGACSTCPPPSTVLINVIIDGGDFCNSFCTQPFEVPFADCIMSSPSLDYMIYRFEVCKKRSYISDLLEKVKEEQDIIDFCFETSTIGPVNEVQALLMEQLYLNEVCLTDYATGIEPPSL